MFDIDYLLQAIVKSRDITNINRPITLGDLEKIVEEAVELAASDSEFPDPPDHEYDYWSEHNHHYGLND